MLLSRNFPASRESRNTQHLGVDVTFLMSKFGRLGEAEHESSTGKLQHIKQSGSPVLKVFSQVVTLHVLDNSLLL